VLFCTNQGGLPLAARGPVVVALSCQRPVHFERAHWAHLCSLSNYLLTSRAPRRAKEYSAWSISFLPTNSLRKPRKEATDGAFYRLVAAARRKQFGAKPGRDVAVTALAYEFLPSQ
jgi:hypothetical protein